MPAPKCCVVTWFYAPPSRHRQKQMMISGIAVSASALRHTLDRLIHEQIAIPENQKWVATEATTGMRGSEGPVSDSASVATILGRILIRIQVLSYFHSRFPRAIRATILVGSLIAC